LHPIVVVVGTDTGVGKTWIACALGRELRRRGCRVVAMKPVETGCASSSPDEDGVLLARATGQIRPQQALFRFRDPVAVPEAADREGRAVDFEAIVRQIRGFSEAADIAIVEGAGGLLSPITWEKNMMDMARELEARVLLVAGDRLGTINHTLLALQALIENSLEPLAVVLSASEQADSSTGTNAKAIARLSDFSRIVCVPRLADPEEGHETIRQIADAALL
jgi:dethiobiotin synthetase